MELGEGQRPECVSGVFQQGAQSSDEDRPRYSWTTALAQIREGVHAYHLTRAIEQRAA